MYRNARIKMCTGGDFVGGLCEGENICEWGGYGRDDPQDVFLEC